MLRPRPTLAAASFLSSEKTADPEELFRSYARHLLRTCDTWGLPVQLGKIRARHRLQRREAPLPQSTRGFLLGNAIFVNGDDLTTRQRFTEAHEIVESLFTLIKTEHPCRFPSEKRKGWPHKERWCESGAAELLMPLELFSPLVADAGIGLEAACGLAGHCRTSLTATIRRMLETDLTPCVFLLLKEGYKKSQAVPSRDGQLVLWGCPRDWDPPSELRVWRRWSSPQVNLFVCENESISRETSIHATLREGELGQVYDGRYDLDLEYIKGPHYTESMKVVIADSEVVMALIHL